MTDKSEFGGSIGTPSEITVNEDGSITEQIAKYLDGSSVVRVTNVDGSTCTTTCSAPTNGGGMGLIRNPVVPKCSSEFRKYWCENLGMCVVGKEECPDYVISPVEIGGPWEKISPIDVTTPPVELSPVKTGLYIKPVKMHPIKLNPGESIGDLPPTTNPVSGPSAPMPPFSGKPVKIVEPIRQIPVKELPLWTTNPVSGQGPIVGMPNPFADQKTGPIYHIQPVDMNPIIRLDPMENPRGNGDMMIVRNTSIGGVSKLSEFDPQAVGDATITNNPGGVTGKVEITKYYPFKSQALEDERSTLKYVSGSVTGSIPIRKKEMMVFHNVV